MAEKKIVELNQTAERIKQILDNIDSTYEDTIAKVSSLEQTTADLGSSVGEQEITIANYESRIKAVEDISGTYDLTYNDDMLRLRKTKGGTTEVVSEVKIVSASEVVSSVITVTPISPVSNTVTLKEPGVIEYKVESLQNGAETGDITVTWKVNNVPVLTETVKQGTNTFKLEDKVKAENNSIVATFVDSLGTIYPFYWSVYVVDMYIESSFSDATPYPGNANVVYTPFGSIEKTIYVLLNGEQVHEEKIKTSGVQSSYIIPHQPHGAYSLEIYCKATMNNGREIESTHLYYDVMFIDDGNETPIIRWPYSGESLTQYAATIFKYGVYTPNSLTSDVKLYINGEEISSQTIDRTEQEWVYKPQITGEDISFTIKTGDIEKTKVLDVVAFPYDVSPVSGYTIDFNPTGRSNNDTNYNVWEYKDSTTGEVLYKMSVSEGFDWNNGGWKVDDNGDTYFCVKAGSRMSIDYPLFQSSEDPKKNGKNFKIIFKTTNNRVIKDSVISCLAENTIINEETGEEKTSYIGLLAGTQEAQLYAGNVQLEVQYVEDEKVELEFNITPMAERDSMLLGYLNADPVRVVTYDNAASFQQSSYGEWKPVTFGSDSCDVHIYRFKAYENSLADKRTSDKAIIQNYIADATNSDEMIARYERNDILDEAGVNIDYNKLMKLYPNLRIILITCPRFTYDKDDKVKGCTVRHMMGNGDPKHNWTAENVQVKGQGTSSNKYGASARNIDIKLNKLKDADGNELDYALTFDDNTTSKKYAMTNDSIAVNYFNIKVNVASSENANNACLAEQYHQYNPYIRQARLDNPKVRDTMEFHPCVIFLKELGTDAKGNQEFVADGQFHFYACGDFGNSKKNHEALGMDIKAYEDYDKAVQEQKTATPLDESGEPLQMPVECIVEITNNDDLACRFKKTPGWSEILPDTYEDVDDEGNQVIRDVWRDDYARVEFRYPEDLFDIIDNEDNEFSTEQVQAANNVYNNLKNITRRLWSWVSSTDSTEVPSEEEVTNGTEARELTSTEKEAEWNTKPYTHDTKEYRLDKFKNEYEQYFHKNSLLYSYLFTDRYLMIDNRAKNVFIHTVDGIKWDFCFDYDNDSALGCDNQGTLKFEYYLEDIDKFGIEDVYNAADSVLWTNVRKMLFSELGTLYRNCDDLKTENLTNNNFNKYQAYKPERLEMFDMRRKYLRPYTDGHYATNIKEGKIVSDSQFLKMLNGRKIYQRQSFEKYRVPYINSKYSFTSQTESASFRAKVSAEEYANTKLWVTPYCWLYVQASWDGQDTDPVRTEAGVKREIALKKELADKNSYIYHPAWLQGIEGLDKFYIRSAEFNRCTRLTKLVVGSNEEGYSNHKNETNSLSISGAKLLEELNVCGWTDPTGWSLDLSGNTNLKKLYTTNSSITSITFASGGLLEEVYLNAIGGLTMVNLKNLKVLELENKTSLTKVRLENTSIVTAKEFLDQCTNLRTVRLVGIDWTIDNATSLDRFLSMSGIDENDLDINNSVLAGKVYTGVIRESQLQQYEKLWPNLTVTYPESGLIQQYLISFYDYDGETLLYSTYIDLGGKPFDPVTEGLIETPTRESTASTNYTFDGWDGDLESEIISSRTFIAKYREETRKYKVVWWKNYVNGEKLQEGEYLYGQQALFTNTSALAPYADPVAGRNSYILFKGWNNSTGYITKDTNVVAQWENGYVDGGNYPEEKREWSAAQLYTVAQRNQIKQYFAEEDPSGSYIPNGDRISIKLGRKFEYENLTRQDIITEPMIFDGSNYYDTGIQLFKEDKDWSLVIEVQFNNAAKDAVLVSCYDYYDKYGFQIANMDASSSTRPYVKWGEKTSSPEDQTYGWGREIFVLVHKKGSSNIETYIGNLSGDNIIQTTLTNPTIVSTESTLVFGALKRTEGEYTNRANGVVYRCELWDGVLGATECREIASWPYESFEFDVVGFNGYRKEDNTTTKIDFFGAQATWGKIRYFTSNHTEDVFGFHSSNLKNWLNTRFFKALPVDWQVIISNTKIPSSTYNVKTLTAGSKTDVTKLWIPSEEEIFTQASDYFKPIYGSEFNRRITRGIHTLDIYSSNADWIYRTTEDPSKSKIIENGSVWINSDNYLYQIYYYGSWFNWGSEYNIANVDGSMSNPQIHYMVSSGGWINTTTTKTPDAKFVVPCFSI